jgi:hypothetical protein
VRGDFFHNLLVMQRSVKTLYKGSPPSRRRVLGNNRMFSKCRIPVIQKNDWCRIPGEIFIMSNRKRLGQGGKFVRKTVNTSRIDLRPWVN